MRKDKILYIKMLLSNVKGLFPKLEGHRLNIHKTILTNEITAANSKIPVIYIICNNKSYRVLKTNMQIYKEEILNEDNPDYKYFAMDFNPSFNFAELANTFGLKGIKISDPTLIKKHVTESLNSEITTVLDIDIDGSV